MIRHFASDAKRSSNGARRSHDRQEFLRRNAIRNCRRRRAPTCDGHLGASASRRTRRASRQALARSWRARPQAGRNRARHAARPHRRRWRAVQSWRSDGDARDRRTADRRTGLRLSPRPRRRAGAFGGDRRRLMAVRSPPRRRRNSNPRADRASGSPPKRPRRAPRPRRRGSTSSPSCAARTRHERARLRRSDVRIPGRLPPHHAGDERAGNDSRLRRSAGAAVAARARRRRGDVDPRRLRDAAVDRAVLSRGGRRLSRLPHRRAARRRARQGDFRAGRSFRRRPRPRPLRIRDGGISRPLDDDRRPGRVARCGGRRFGSTGPGIKGEATFAVSPLPTRLPRPMGGEPRRFPLGVDLLFVADARLAALPRSTAITVGAR